MEGVLIALFVFVLRIVNNAISTIRVVYIARQEMLIAAVLGFFEALIFAYTVANVVNDLTNWLMLGAYTLGYAVGSYVGMALEKRIVQTFLTANIVLQKDGTDLANALRSEGFGVTVIRGEGKDGEVIMLRAIIDRRDSRRLSELVREHNPNAFVAMEETRGIQQGHFRQMHSPRQ